MISSDATHTLPESTPDRPIIFGEVLFDVLESGERVLGGAPFNVAWHLQAFGFRPHLVTRIGDDKPGREILHRMNAWGMDTSGVQLDSQHATGEVLVTIEAGEPTYEIAHPRAWDFISAQELSSELTSERDPEHSTDVSPLLYHGSLALRHHESHGTLNSIREHLQGSASVFVDVNLRPPWWNRETVLAHLQHADIAKLNEDELLALGADASGGSEACARSFRATLGLSTLVVTRGASGALAVDGSGALASVSPDSDLHVVDTVGAGDAFSAVLIAGQLRNWPITTCLQRAQRFASRVVGQRGATAADTAIYWDLLDEWSLPLTED